MKSIKLAIIGSGPAGYTAAIYSGRALLKPVLFSGYNMGGQLMYTTDLENFPGFPDGVMGPKFMMSLKTQAENFNTQIIHQHVLAVDFSQRPFKLWTSVPKGLDTTIFSSNDGQKISKAQELIKKQPPDYLAQAVIISTGATPIKLGISGETKLIGKGVSSCAVCDAAFFKDKKVYVVGGGDTAMEDALALTRYTNDVTIIHRRDQFRASKIMQDRVFAKKEQIKILWESVLTEVIGEQKVEKIKVETQGQKQVLPADGVFLAIGRRPISTIFQDQIQLDQSGYIITAQAQTKAGLELAKQGLNCKQMVEFPTATSVAGVFAAGDVVDQKYRQAIIASAMGAAAALDVERYLEGNLTTCD